MEPHVLFLSHHLPLGNEPGAFRPWMEARLLHRAGFRVTVITAGVQYLTGEDIRPGQGWCVEEWVDGIRILRTWGPIQHRRSLRRRVLHYLSFTLLAGLASLFHVKKVDYVFAGTDPFFILPMVYLVALIKRASMIMDERDLYPDDAIGLGIIKEGWVSRLIFEMMQYFRRRASSILVATPTIRNRLLSYGCPDSKVFLLYNADVYLHEDIDQDYDRSLRVETGKQFLVGYAGGLGPSNDIPTLLRALEHLRYLDNLGVVIIGAGDRLKFYQEYCRDRGLENVYFTGPLSRRRTRNLINQLDVCLHVLPYKDEISLPSKIFDYQGLGKPMIFGGRGDTVDYLQVSGGGVVVPPEDDRALASAIRRLWEDKPFRLQMGVSARHYFERQITLDKACDIIKKTINAQNS
jgi:glycosyltransferase involved in cell wall biosynthesis